MMSPIFCGAAAIAHIQRFSGQLLHLKISVDYYLYTQLLFLKLKPPKERAVNCATRSASAGNYTPSR